MRRIVDGTNPDRRKPEAEPPEGTDPLNEQRRRQGQGKGEASERHHLEETALRQDRVLMPQGLGRGFGRRKQQEGRDTALHDQEHRAGPDKTSNRPAPEQIEDPPVSM